MPTCVLAGDGASGRLAQRQELRGAASAIAISDGIQRLRRGGDEHTSRVDRIKTSVLTHVGLPGVTLSAGKYAFELANPEASADIIRVRNMATKRVVFLGFTYRVERPKGMALDRLIVFGEAPRGAATPILAWYPNGDATGHQFKYSDRPSAGDRR